MSPTGPGVASARHDRSCRPARPTVAVRAGLDTGCDDRHARAQRGLHLREAVQHALERTTPASSSWSSRSDPAPTAPTGSPPRWRPRTRGSVPSPAPPGGPRTPEPRARGRAPRGRGARGRTCAAAEGLRAGRGRDARRHRRGQRRRCHGCGGPDPVRAGGRPRDAVLARRRWRRVPPRGHRRAGAHRLPRGARAAITARAAPNHGCRTSTWGMASAPIRPKRR